MIASFDILSFLPSLIYPALTLAQLIIVLRTRDRPGGLQMTYGTAAILAHSVWNAVLNVLLNEGVDFVYLQPYVTAFALLGMVGMGVFLLGLNRYVRAGAERRSGQGNLLDRY